MDQNLSGIPETMLIALWARAAESKRENPIIRDDQAVHMVGQIEYDFSKFNNGWLSQLGVAVRTEILDREVNKFIRNYPDGVIINIGCGLDTRYFRLNNGKVHWYDLDLPEAIDIRKNFFCETQCYKMIPKSVFDNSWINEVDVKDRQVLIIAEGILMYFTEKQVKALMNTLVENFPGANMLFEMFPSLLVKQSKRHDTVKKTSAKFQWGIKNGREILKMNSHIQFTDEWNLFDFHHKRWRWMGWFARISAFKNNFNDRIVHIHF